MTSLRGKLTALVCHLTKRVNKAEELTYLSTNIDPQPGSTNEKGRISTVDLLIKAPCFVRKSNIFLYFKMRECKLVITRRSTVLSLPLQQGFPAPAIIPAVSDANKKF